MQANFHQYSAVELYIPCPDKDTAASESEEELQKTGCIFFDTFLHNLYHEGIHSSLYHASLLGIDNMDLCYTVKTLTGKTYTDFVSDFILLKAKDMLRGDNKKNKKAISDKLGFGSYSGFYKFLMKNGAITKKKRRYL